MAITGRPRPLTDPSLNPSPFPPSIGGPWTNPSPDFGQMPTIDPAYVARLFSSLSGQVGGATGAPGLNTTGGPGLGGSNPYTSRMLNTLAGHPTMPTGGYHSLGPAAQMGYGNISHSLPAGMQDTSPWGFSTYARPTNPFTQAMAGATPGGQYGGHARPQPNLNAIMAAIAAHMTGQQQQQPVNTPDALRQQHLQQQQVGGAQTGPARPVY